MQARFVLSLAKINEGLFTSGMVPGGIASWVCATPIHFVWALSEPASIV